MLTQREQQHDQHGYDARQRVLDALLRVAQQITACAACTTSAAMYLAALAGRGIGYERQEFISLAGRVWDDVARQQKNTEN